MKKYIWIVLFIAFVFPSMYAQDVDEETDEVAPEEEINSSDDISEPDSIYSEDKDTTYIRIGKKSFNIIEDEEGTSLEIKDIDEDKKDEKKHSSNKFKGHWSGVDIGINNFLDKDFSMSRTDAESYMDLNTTRSINVNANFIQHDFRIVGDHFGLVTGMGIEWSNYFFDNNNSIRKNDSTGVIESFNYTDLDINLNKSKLSTWYLTVPLILELQLGNGKRKDRVHIGAGVIGGVKIGSSTKVVYRENNQKQKDKTRNDFNLNTLRYGVIARIGYKDLNLYSIYYPVSMFEKNKGPELYPFSVGLSLDI